MRVLRWFAVAAAVAPVLAFAPQGSAASATATLRPGQAAFWNGSGDRDFTIVVRPGAWRLRVAWDVGDFRQGAGGDLLDPSGKHVTYIAGYDSGEAYVLNPRPGTWTVKMTSTQPYRMRAKLETRPVAPRTARPLLPNLRLVPPHEFTFTGPVGVGAFSFGVSPATTCSGYEMAEEKGVRCLRFSLGPSNVGQGPLQLVFPGNQGLVTPGKATQLVTWTDGHVTERPAGEFLYHKTHAHYHHSGFGSLELLKVTDTTRGTMEKVGTGPKQGFCTGDIKIAEWEVFGGVQDSSDSQCLNNAALVYDPTAGTKMGLSPGWADLYSWEQDGNYVEFGLTNGDGRYVIRSTADALNNVLESDESDNTGYAYIEVTGQTIRVLERGRGTSPWDRRKVVTRDNLHPNA
ncbi:MAG TPA: lysyl oxidase family protein [Mycobacteriales bacterium]|jgi:hypothetical protein